MSDLASAIGPTKQALLVRLETAKLDGLDQRPIELFKLVFE